MSMWGAEGQTLGDMIIANSQPAPPPYVAPPPAPVIPTDAAGAVARLNELKSSPEWREKWLAGNPREGGEYRDLRAMIEKGGNPEVDAAIAGVLDDGPFQPQGRREMIATAEWLREAGIEDPVIRQTLEGYEITQHEYNLAAARKAERLRDHEWTKAWMAGDGAQRKEMMTLNIILSSPIKRESA